MSASNDRLQERGTVHHLMSRIAHRVYFLKEDERNDFMGMMRRTAEFAGLKLLGWCIMANHFHILVYIPCSEPIDEDEIVRRVGVLKGENGKAAFLSWIESERMRGEDGEKNVSLAFDRLRARMDGNVGNFMKTLKQWFTQEYNHRTSHAGTLWESVYRDRGVEMKTANMSRVLAYIHLNPIRAAACSGFCDYKWSSLHSAEHGDRLALDGLKFIYGDELSDKDAMDGHLLAMDDALEHEKRKRAMDIARKRAAGYETPDDPLTDEAYVAQAAAHLEAVRKAGIEWSEDRYAYQKCAAKREEIEHLIVDAIRTTPDAAIDQISKKLSLPYSTARKYIAGLQKRGIIMRKHRNDPWTINAV